MRAATSPLREAGAEPSGAVLGSVLAALGAVDVLAAGPHAPMANAATRTSAPICLGVVIVTRCSSYRSATHGGFNGQSLRSDAARLATRHQRPLFEPLRDG